MKGTGWEIPIAPLPPLQGDIEADVCVIGLGGSGLAAIRRLQRNRVSRIVGIDAVGVGAGAAGSNGGLLLGGTALFHHHARARWGPTFAADLYRMTTDRIRRLAREIPQWVDGIGSVRLSASREEEEDLEEHYQAMQADSLPVSRWEQGGQSGLFLPDDAVFHPAWRCAELAERAWTDGAWLYGRTRVIGLDGVTVRTERGVVRAQQVLICVDGLLHQVMPQLASRVQPVRLQMLSTAPISPITGHPAIYSRNGMDYWQQRPDGRLFLGGHRDAGDEEEGQEDPQCTAVVQSALTRTLDGLVGRAEVERQWAAIVGYTTDYLPIVEEASPGVWVAGGYCGTGNVVGTLAGEAIADAVSKNIPHELVTLLDSVRKDSEHREDEAADG